MNELDKLKDIKPPVEVEGSFWLFLILIILSLLLFGAIGYFLYKFLKRRKKRRKTKRELALDALREIDFKDTKKAVYDFTENAFLAIEEDMEKEEKLKNILKELEIYKYKKDIPPLSKEHIKMMKKFIKEIEK